MLPWQRGIGSSQFAGLFFCVLDGHRERRQKEHLARKNWWRWAGIVGASVLLFAPRMSYLKHELIPESTSINGIALVICASGICFAIWARRHLGRNWSAAPSLNEGHELVTSGTYRLVRHPIYAGVLFAMFWSALIFETIWLLAYTALCAIYVSHEGRGTAHDETVCE